MRFVSKYGIGMYLVVTLLFKLSFIIPITLTNSIFYFLMVFGLLSFFWYYNTFIYNKIVLKSFFIFLSVNTLNLIFLLFFDHTIQSSIYFFAKFATFNVVILGIVYNYSFYRNLFVNYFKYVMLVMVLLGEFFGLVEESDYLQRMSLGYNPNDVGVFGMLGVISIIAMDKLWYKKKVNLTLFILLTLVTLLSGSKAALLCLGLGVLLTYGINYRTVYSVLLFLPVAYFSSDFGYITTIDRLSSEEDVFETRNEVYAIGLETIKDNMWVGNGLDKYGWTNPKYWDSPELALGPHNTYLSVAIMYGVVFGFVFLIIVSYFMVQKFRESIRNDDHFIRFCYIVAILVFVDGFFETLIVAINEFLTLLFWFFVGCIGYNFSLSKKLVK